MATKQQQQKQQKQQQQQKQGEKREKEEFELFYGNKSPFSQHHPTSFRVDGVLYNCAEQYMMHQKAVVFKDSVMAKKIMASTNPVQQKKMGRKVQNFDKDVWSRTAPGVVKTATLAKFSQNPALLARLLETHPRTLAEASPRDRLWGIGMGASNPKAQDRSLWRGRNLLGDILTQVREQLRLQGKEKEEEEKEEKEKKGEEKEKKTVGKQKKEEEKKNEKRKDEKEDPEKNKEERTGNEEEDEKKKKEEKRKSEEREKEEKRMEEKKKAGKEQKRKADVGHSEQKIGGKVMKIAVHGSD